MKNKTRPLPKVNNFRPTLRSYYSFAAHSAQAIAERERHEDAHYCSPSEHGPTEAALSRVPLNGFGISGACIVCGLTPAPFLDLERGGMVCAAHKPERGPA